MEKLTRRNFIKGAGLATLGVAGASALAACSPAAPATEATDTSIGSGRWSWDVAPDPVADADISETVECEVLIIGAGAAGTCAAYYAGETGVDAVVMQKLEGVQSNGWSCGTWYSPLGEENGIEWDVPAALQLFAQRYGNGRVNMKLVRRVMEASGQVGEYIRNNIDKPVDILAKDEHIVYYWTEGEGFANRYNGFRNLLSTMAETAESKGVRFRYKTPAQYLLTDGDGSVIGAVGDGPDGYVKVLASKGVVLCTGDVTDDEEMLECYCPMMCDSPTLHAQPCNTGDGHKMGLWAGADMDKAPFSMMLHFDPSILSSVAPPFAAIPWLHVNKNGERFTNENVDYQSVGTAVQLQPDHMAWQIIDSHYMDHVFDYTNGGRTTSMTPEDWQRQVDAGSILEGQTLEELAEMAGLPKDTFLATVKRYNELVDKGVDEDFGMASEYFVWNGIKDAPFYAIPRQPAKLATCGGLKCNDEFQVISTEGSPISGLYAAGNVQGSFFGYDYPVNNFGGFSIGRAMTGGFLAVQSAMGELGEEIYPIGL